MKRPIIVVSACLLVVSIFLSFVPEIAKIVLFSGFVVVAIIGISLLGGFLAAWAESRKAKNRFQ